MLLLSISRCALKYRWTVLTGDYTEDVARRFSVQLLVWIVVLLLTKVVVLLFSYAMSAHLSRIGVFIFEPWQSAPHAELVLVMVIIPSVLNLVYFWIADSWLRIAEKRKDAPSIIELSGVGGLCCDAGGVTATSSGMMAEEGGKDGAAGEEERQDGARNILYSARSVLHISDHIAVCGGGANTFS